MMFWISFRARILAIVLAVGIVPLLVIGVWLTGQTARSGEELLRERLADSLDRTASTVAQRWIPFRSELLDLVETAEVRAWLDGAGGAPIGGPPPGLIASAAAMDPAIDRVSIQVGGETAWSLDAVSAESSALFGAPLTVSLPIFAVDGRRLGVLEAGIRFLALRGPVEASAAGGVISAIDPATSAVLVPVPFDPTLVGVPAFSWNDADWVGLTRELSEPTVILVAAAPVQPFAAPFESAARESLLALLTVAALGLLAAALMTGRLTASLENLAAAARAVAAGNVASTLPVTTRDEVGAVTDAFNTMTRSLRRTLRQLADRESLAAVNEFAASLAHEVRNPLTSIQLDLQQVEEQLPADSELRVLQGDALEGLRRLDRTVGRALDVARSGLLEPRPIDLVETLRTAIRRAEPAVERRGGRIELQAPEEGLPTTADPDALEQLFLNLLLNSAEVIGEGERIVVTALAGEDTIDVRIDDEGIGIPADELEHIFEPFFTTRPGGTGLGLAVARRIVAAHNGSIRIESEENVGTSVEIQLPLRDSLRMT